jgi:hypothetical protein
MIETGYLRTFALGVAILFGLFLAFTWFMDPYGVSPMRLSLQGINALKPKRLDIDRLIKPYEVWRYRPRTVFLGTSRIHQSIDPTVLDGTRFAPAYNASIPASTLSENAAHLEQFFRLNDNLRVVFVELFLYNFIIPEPQSPEKSSRAFLQDTASLFLSAGAAFDSLQTLVFNLSGLPSSAHVAALGYWVAPTNFRTSFGQKEFIDFIMKTHNDIPSMSLQSTAFAALDGIVDLCQKNDAQLYLLITPSYPWDDYRLLSMGYWPLLEDWLRRISTYRNVISFSQYNDLLEEPPALIMKYWNDPLHFNINTGRLMLRSLLGASDPDIPLNFLRPVVPDTVETVMQERRSGLNHWSGRNPHFTKAFDRAKLMTGNDRSLGKY